MAVTDEELKNRFLYHPPGPGARELHEDVSKATLEMARVIVQTTQSSRQQAVALTKLEETRMWWNAAVALDNDPGVDQNER